MVSTIHHHHATKRKNDDNDLSSAAAPNGHSTTTFYHRPPTTAVVYSPRNVNSSSSINWNQCQSRLRTLLQQCDDDPIMDDIATMSTLSMKQTVLDEPQSTKLQRANDMSKMMEAEIQQIMAQVQNVSTVVSSLQQQYDTLLHYYETKQRDVNDGQRQQERHENRIQAYQHSVQESEVKVDQNQQDLYQTVPRLQHSISLYVNMTGIKWKYDDDNGCDGNEEEKVFLTGEINKASKQTIHRFQIDITPNDSEPQRHKYEIAQKLWNMMDGCPTTTTTTNLPK